MNEITINAAQDNLDQVLGFVEERMQKEDYPVKTILQTALAVEEVFVNIAKYAYTPRSGVATIRVSALPDRFCIEFSDTGIPYNPLEKKDANITLTAEQRQIGGLGILMTKKLMDEVHYQFSEGKNILTLIKNK